MTEVEVHQDIVHFFNRYLNTRPAQLPIMIDRILRSWYSNPAMMKMWIQNPKLIPSYRGTCIKIDVTLSREKDKGTSTPYQKVPENKVMRVNIDHTIGKAFNLFSNKFGLNPCDLATWLCRVFIKQWSIVHFEKLNKRRKMTKLQAK